MLILSSPPDPTPPLVSVDVPLLVQSVGNLRESWQARNRRVGRERQTVTTYLFAQAGRATGPHLTSVHKRLLITFVRRASRRLDDDNLAGGCKGPRDAVAEWLGVDDGSRRLIWAYDQEPHKRYRNTPSLLIEVRSLDAQGSLFGGAP